VFAEYYWKPSINIHDAWRVVEELGEDGYDVMLTRCGLGGQAWEVTVADRETGLEIEEAHQSAPRAICIAALRAMEASDE